MNRMLTLGVFSSAALIIFPVFANHEDQSAYQYADVVGVEPIVESIEVPVDERVCWNEKVYHDHPRYVSGTPSILGSIIGGVVGNQFGGGHGKDLATAAGVSLGGSVGRDIQRKNQRQRSYIGTERRCETERSWRSEERVVGYQVSYEYDGEIYNTRLDQPPGDQIRVQVSVSPVDGY